MAVPPQLKAIQHHYRTALEHDKRDPVVAYYCRLYAMQTGMKLDSKTPECRKFLVKLMDHLEKMKQELSSNESISQEIVGNAHIENYALKMFLYADNEDRSGLFHKNMIKSFYTASLLFDVLSVFGELSEEVRNEPGGLWSVCVIIVCGISVCDDEFGAVAGGPSPPHPCSSADPTDGGPASMPPPNYNTVQVPPGSHAPANTPADLPHPAAEPMKPVPVPRTVAAVEPTPISTSQQGEVHLTPEDFTQAQKYCKYAGNALLYEDVSTAIQNLQKALKLLTIGKE
ncbi:vacuolar protein sorting-associated protein VTA1-like, partial [Silurus asotus]